MTILLHQEARDDDVPVWKWLLQVIQRLGVDGMSSEDTDNANVLETVYRVKVLQWRKDISHELALIDEKRIADDEIYAPQGAKPPKRFRSGNNRLSTRPPVPELPEIFYDTAWISQQTSSFITRTLAVSKEQFKWLEVYCKASTAV
jgi:hypothetical protein